MTLATGREIHRNKWVELPVGDELLARVKSLAIQEGQPPVSTKFIYEWGNGTEISDSVEIDDNNINDSCQPILFDTINSNAEETFNDTDSIISDNGILDDDGEPIENENPIVLEESNNDNEEDNTTVLNEENLPLNKKKLM